MVSPINHSNHSNQSLRMLFHVTNVLIKVHRLFGKRERKREKNMDAGSQVLHDLKLNYNRLTFNLGKKSEIFYYS